MPVKEECGICGRVFPYRYLRRCQKCGRLFCRDCMVPDVSTGDVTKMLCLNCARRIVSPSSKSKYGLLTSYLRYRGSFTSRVKLSFAKIDGIIGDNLPMSAYRDEKWWSNLPSVAHARAWLTAGWKTEEVSLAEGYVIFKKAENLQQTKHYARRRRRQRVEKPFTPAPYRFPRSRKLSKTKIARLHAKLKNLERRRASMVKHRGKFKPRSAHEKRLFKPEEKPKWQD
jgi:hypothetical protein